MEIREQIKRKCKHFTGLLNKECSVGVKYDDVKDKSIKPFGLPCIENNGYCENYTAKTVEEIDAEELEIERLSSMSIESLIKIKSKIKKNGELRGSIECPLCEGNLNYIASSSNGHVWSICKCGFGWKE
jgi:hypothetical protein